MLTLKEAAKETGLTRAAIYKAIQRGRLLATKDNNGIIQIDPAELTKVYKMVKKIDVKRLFRWWYWLYLPNTEKMTLKKIDLVDLGAG